MTFREQAPLERVARCLDRTQPGVGTNRVCLKVYQTCQASVSSSDPIDEWVSEHLTARCSVSSGLFGATVGVRERDARCDL